MPRRKSGIKRLRADKKRKLRNTKIKTELKKTLKKYLLLVAAKKMEEAKLALKEAISKLDKAATKGIIHRNTASRKISRLSRKLQVK